MSHNTILRNINALFASSTWTQHNYDTIPTGFTGKINPANKTVRVNVMQYSSNLFFDGDHLSGQIVCQIFVPREEGMNAATQIADNLDVLLKKKTISGNLQTTNSLIKMVGIDPNNTDLLVCSYEVNFNYYN